MKRFNNLFEKICEYDNLVAAHERARQGKSRNYGVKIFERNPEMFLLKLQDQLLSGTYHTSKYTTFKIYEPKERIIYRLPYYPDRIVHHAIMRVLEPIWVGTLISQTYACVKGRGIHKVHKDLVKALRHRTGNRYCLKLDIKKFYPSIDHEELKKVIRKKIKDKKLLVLLDEIIDSTDGVPIGNYLSQFFANLFLSDIDHWMKEVKKQKYYFRYADDIVILSDSKEELHQLRKEIEQKLKEKKLTLKKNYAVFEVEKRGIDFLGYVFRHRYIRLRASTKKRLFHKLKSYRKYPKKLMHDKLGSYFGWLKYCNSKRLKRSLNNYLKHEIFK